MKPRQSSQGIHTSSTFCLDGSLKHGCRNLLLCDAFWNDVFAQVMNRLPDWASTTRCDVLHGILGTIYYLLNSGMEWTGDQRF
ncbi:hypothetical protein Hamer_G009971 [Homarus americanus]|uniref:Uncharacterized protein n=1 Tax=Homarus americanus TaxID=6706 RepID=A0A8J5JH84_HOMAM|nr:hypothetical protein Hamer_G009971 [Homarus americanus]